MRPGQTGLTWIDHSYLLFYIWTPVFYPSLLVAVQTYGLKVSLGRATKPESLEDTISAVGMYYQGSMSLSLRLPELTSCCEERMGSVEMWEGQILTLPHTREVL